MKNGDRERFMHGMEQLRLVLPTSIHLTEKEEVLRIEEFWNILKPYSIQQVEMAFDSVKVECFFFPTPAEMLAYLRNHDYSPAEAEEEPAALIDLQRHATNEMARTALDLIFGVLDKKITLEELAQGMEELEKKKPNVGPLSWGRAAEMVRRRERAAI